MKTTHAAIIVGSALLSACATPAVRDESELTELREQVASLERRLDAAETRTAEAVAVAATQPRVSDENLADPLTADRFVVKQLVVQDAQGRDRVILGSDPDGVGLSLFDAEGKRRAFLQVNSHQNPRFVLLDRDEEWRFHASLLHGDAPYVGLYGGPNRRKNIRIEAPIEGAVGMGMSGGPGAQNETSHMGSWIWEDGTMAWGGGLRSSGRTGFILKYDRDGKSEFQMRDANEKSIWSLPAK